MNFIYFTLKDFLAYNLMLISVVQDAVKDERKMKLKDGFNIEFFFTGF